MIARLAILFSLLVVFIGIPALMALLCRLMMPRRWWK